MNSAELLPPEMVELEQDTDALLELSAQVEQAARTLDLEDWIVQRLKHAEREITVNLPLVRDNGAAATCTGFRVQHCSVHGPCLGPVLLSPEAHLSHLRALAMHISLQCALLGLPAAGSAGALVCDPEQLSERELRRVVKDYVTALRDCVGAYKDVLAPDGNEFAMAWMYQALARAHGDVEPAAVVGKPAVLGGVAEDNSAGGTGVFVLVEQVLAEQARALAEARVAIQGLGRVGASAARLLHGASAKVVAVADKSGGVCSEDGLDIPGLLAHVERTHFVLGYAPAEPASNAEVLEAACDVLIAAAAERQINMQNAPRIHASLVVEATRGAVTPAAEKILRARGITVVPDVLGTAAATVAWFVEWQHGIHFAAPMPAEVQNAVRTRLLEAWRAVRKQSGREAVSLRAAAYIVALGRLAAAMRVL